MMKHKTYFILFLTFSLLLPLYSIAQRELLSSGPMNGYSAMREVTIWIQTKEACELQLKYWPRKSPKQIMWSSKVKTTLSNAFTQHLIADQLEPGNMYEYTVLINGEDIQSQYPLHFETQPLWQHRTDPPAFKAAIGSCAYINEPAYDRPGTPYGRNYQIFKHINARAPNMMMWLGDNIYLREADYDSKTGIYKRYTHYRSLPEIKPLLGKMHHYAIWDDHDYGPNDADRSYPLKDVTLQAFKDFWANPSYGVNGHKGITGKFSFYDIDFFLLDNRYFRTSKNRKTGDKYILGDHQIEWLIDQLKFSKAPFKMVCVGGQFISNAAIHENHAQFAEERQKLIDLIFEEEIKGVVFLTGDRHHTELSQLKRGNNIIYDLTVSPLTSGAYDHSKENNTNRVLNTIIGTQNFGMLDFKGPLGKRILTMTIYDFEGKKLWTKEITQP